MVIYKILAMIPTPEGRKIVKLLNSDKKVFDKNLSILKKGGKTGKAEIVFSGITKESQDLKDYKKHYKKLKKVM